MTEINQYLGFIKEIKSVTRTDWTQSGRQESTAEHAWRLVLFRSAYCKKIPELDYEK
ncbi:HD domain-containing protein [Marinilactibacillus psychrotolerans]|uniref:HD domain-containing protein n=1 Tax=Marinilactibacillus psychrotolerans TaxID=191770 RepID=UPI00388B901A